MSVWHKENSKSSLAGYIADNKLNWCWLTISRLHQEQMIGFKKAKTIEKLSGYQNLLIIEAIAILCWTTYTCNDTLSYIIPISWIMEQFINYKWMNLWFLMI